MSKFLREVERRAGLKTYQGKPCKHGHDGVRLTSSDKCVKCHTAHAAAYYKANAEKVAARKAAYRKANPEKVAAYQAAYYKANAEKRASQQAAYRKVNVEKLAVYEAVFRKVNPDKYAAYSAKRRAAKLLRTPAWADHTRIAQFYAHAAFLGAHVDHIIPLQGRKVSGLHVPENLQLLTPTENCSKNNRFEVSND